MGWLRSPAMRNRLRTGKSGAKEPGETEEEEDEDDEEDEREELEECEETEDELLDEELLSGGNPRSALR